MKRQIMIPKLMPNGYIVLFILFTFLSFATCVYVKEINY